LPDNGAGALSGSERRERCRCPWRCSPPRRARTGHLKEVTQVHGDVRGRERPERRLFKPDCAFVVRPCQMATMPRRHSAAISTTDHQVTAACTSMREGLSCRALRFRSHGQCRSDRTRPRRRRRTRPTNPAFSVKTRSPAVQGSLRHNPPLPVSRHDPRQASHPGSQNPCQASAISPVAVAESQEVAGSSPASPTATRTLASQGFFSLWRDGRSLPRCMECSGTRRSGPITKA
jgi:hypothetical protein